MGTENTDKGKAEPGHLVNLIPFGDQEDDNIATEVSKSLEKKECHFKSAQPLILYIHLANTHQTSRI